MSAEPVWFGPSERPLLGWVHRPDGDAARGGVLLCPPVGIDLSYADAVYRGLARALERAGFAVVRFDYDGTGQSAGTMSDPGRVAAWLASTEHALALVRETGVDWVAGVGLRLGAVLLARTAAETGGFDALALWDPYPSGKTFIREQRALQLAVRPNAGGSGTGGVEIPGYLIDDETVAELSELTLPVDRASAERVLVLLEPTRTSNDRFAPLLALPGVDVLEQHPGPGIYDTGPVSYRLPPEPVEQIVGWLDAQRGAGPTPLRSSAEPPAGAVAVARLEDGRAIVEEPLRLGPNRLFGIACEPRGAGGDALSAGPTILLLSIAAEPSIGPARQWVELARAWAELGYRSVRFDLAGMGESPCRPGGRGRDIYGAGGLDDIAEAAAAVSPDDPSDVILIGVCSGAYAALAVGPKLRPRGLVAINPILSFAAFVPETTGHGAAAWRASRLRRLARSVGGFGQGTTWRDALGDRLPTAAWRAVYRLGFSFSPARVLDPIVAAEVPALVMCGTEEARVPSRRAPRAVGRLNDARLSRFEVEPALHHSLLHEASRSAVRTTVTRFVASVA